MRAPNTKKMAMACAAALLTLGLSQASFAEDVTYIPFVNTEIKSETMPKVFFTHDKHNQYLNDDCEACHDVNETPDQFLAIAQIPADQKVQYMHEQCITCHERRDAGPRITDCRSCHNAAIAAAQK